jgi:hypothetical protein
MTSGSAGWVRVVMRTAGSSSSRRVDDTTVRRPSAVSSLAA